MSELPLFKQTDERDALKKRCRAKGIKLQTLLDLVEVEIEMVGRARKRGINEKFDEIFDQEISSNS